MFPPSAVAGGRALSGGCDPGPPTSTSRPRLASRYPGAAPSPDESEIESNKWTAADAIQVAYREWVFGGYTGSSMVSEIESRVNIPLLSKVHRKHLEAEVRRVLPSRYKRPSERLQGDRETLALVAHKRLVWATGNTLEVNPAVLARFAVEVAYDDLFRMNVAAVLSQPWSIIWNWSAPPPEGSGREVQLTKAFKSNPKKARKQFASLDTSTAAFAETQLPLHNQVHPFEGLQPSWTWAMDPIRPPISALRTTVAIIRRTLEHEGFGLPDFEFMDSGTPKPPVLGIELGHSAGGLALALFLKGHEVRTCSAVFDSPGQDDLPTEFKAVVVNLPHAAAMAYVKDHLRRCEKDIPVMNRIENDRYWRWSCDDQGEHCQFLVQHGVEHLAIGGVIVVLGDTLSGQIHLSAREMEAHGGMEEVPIWPGGPMALSFDYTKKPWSLYGCIRPTGRLLRAWRRVR